MSKTRCDAYDGLRSVLTHTQKLSDSSAKRPTSNGSNDLVSPCSQLPFARVAGVKYLRGLPRLRTIIGGQQ